MQAKLRRPLATLLAAMMVVGLFAAFPPAVGAANAESLKATIEGFAHGGSGEPLTATVSGNTVTVTGSVTGATNKLTLNIDAGTTVRWQADYHGTTSVTASNLIYLEGPGTFDVAAGGVIAADGPGSTV